MSQNPKQAMSQLGIEQIELLVNGDESNDLTLGGKELKLLSLMDCTVKSHGSFGYMKLEETLKRMF